MLLLLVETYKVSSFHNKYIANITNVSRQAFPHFKRLFYAAMGEGTVSSDLIPGFHNIAPHIWQHNPNTTTRFNLGNPHSESPTHVLLLTWTGARCQSIANYTNIYLSRFPTAHFFIVTTSVKDLHLRSLERKQERLKPLLEHLICPKKCESMQILLHIFSEGGSNKAIELARLYHKETGSRLPVSALCFDSTPSHTRCMCLYSALDRFFPPHPIFNQISFVIGRVLSGGIWVMIRVCKGHRNSLSSREHHRLLDPVLFDLSAPRCYLHWTDHTLVGRQTWRNIRKYSQASIDLDIPVTEAIFASTEYCIHARDKPEQYWGAIKQTWRKAVAKHEYMLVADEASLVGMGLAERKGVHISMAWKY